MPGKREAKEYSKEINRLAPGLTECKGPDEKTIYLPLHYPFVDRLNKKFENRKTKLKIDLQIKPGIFYV